MLLLLIRSCKNKIVDPVFDAFDTYASKSDKVVIRYHTIHLQNLKDTGISTIITDISNIKRLRDLIKESKKSEDCYRPTGMISFYKDGEEFVSLEFGLTLECPSVYIYFKGKPNTYKISYQLGMFLDYRLNQKIK